MIKSLKVWSFFLAILSSIFLNSCSMNFTETTIEGNDDKVTDKQEAKENARVKGHVTVTPAELW